MRPISPHARSRTLSRKDIELLILKANGVPTKQIAADKGISQSCIRWRLSLICATVGAHNTAHAIAIAYRTGMITHKDITLPATPEGTST